MPTNTTCPILDHQLYLYLCIHCCDIPAKTFRPLKCIALKDSSSFCDLPLFKLYAKEMMAYVHIDAIRFPLHRSGSILRNIPLVRWPLTDELCSWKKCFAHLNYLLKTETCSNRWNLFKVKVRTSTTWQRNCPIYG